MVGGLQLAIAAGIVDQGAAFLHPRIDDFADHDVMVAGGDAIPERAFDKGEAAGQKRHAGASRSPVDAVETITFAGGEMVGNVALMFVQNIYAEVHAGPEMFQNTGAVVQADGYEGRR